MPTDDRQFTIYVCPDPNCGWWEGDEWLIEPPRCTGTGLDPDDKTKKHRVSTMRPLVVKEAP